MKLLLILLTFANIKCPNDTTTGFNYKQAIGIWIPYQHVYADGSINNGSFTGATFFGVYAESIRFNKDKTFTPVCWTDKDNYFFKKEERGTIEYINETKKLILKSSSLSLEFEVVRFDGNELWLQSDNKTIYKFRKQIP